ncbi:hypothetical protein QUB76_17310 [Microcoleus sp. D2B6]
MKKREQKRLHKPSKTQQYKKITIVGDFRETAHNNKAKTLGEQKTPQP